MPRWADTHPTPPPTIRARSSAELRKPAIRTWVASTALMGLIWFLMLPWSVALFGVLAWLLGGLVTWVCTKVR